MADAPRRDVVVPRSVWTAWESAHAAAVDDLTRGHRERRRRGESHPVEDFLFTYYPASVASVRRWHPGPGLLLEGAHETARREWRHYREETVGGSTGLVVDAAAVRARAAGRLERHRAVVAATAGRAPDLGCFGLHEWAMLYRARGSEVRHASVPLRLPAAEVDAVVERSGVRCTHFDAFRFFTPEAVPLNAMALTPGARAEHEQPACLHAGMDLYRVACDLGAGCPGELLVDCLRAAYDARTVDMRSSPYDLRAFGLDPIPVETAGGRAVFAEFQRGWARRTTGLRRRILAAIDRVVPAAAGPSGRRARLGGGGADGVGE